jgi:hypothetical protein
MTEIKIEKKKPVWPWILGLAILVFLIYFLAIYDRPDMKEAPPQTTSLIDVKENNVTVAEFVRFAEEDSKDMGVDHVYTNEALLKLIEAINAMAAEINFDVKADLDKAREYAKVITEDEFKASHANSIRNAADILTDALQRMQQARYPELTNEASELRKAAGSIKPDVLTLDQKDEVKGFFGQAADLLKKMN